MKDSRQEIQVGFAIIVAVVVLVGGLMWFEGYRYDRDSVRVEVQFPTVGGLGTGDPVHVRGIPLGKVESVELASGGVRVGLRLRGEVPLREDTRFRVGSLGLMGERMVELEPGRGAAVSDPGARIFDGEYSLAISEMMGEMEELSVQLGSMLEQGRGVLLELGDGRLQETLAEATRAARLAGDVLADSGDDLRRASRSLASAGGQLDAFLSEHREGMGVAVEGAARGAAALDSLVGQLRRVSAGADSVLLAIREQRGALGRMVYDEQMGEDLESSVSQLRWLVEDIRRNPQRYLTVKIF